MDAKKSVGVCLVGSGSMAKSHSNAYHTIPYMFPKLARVHRLVVLASDSEERGRAAAERYGFARSAVGWQAAIADPEVDLVDVSNGDFLHKDTAIAALRQGKHVLCEKPMAANLADAKAMLDCASRSGVKAMCGFNYRFLPAVVLAKRLIESGAMGRVYSFNGVYLQDVGAYDDTPYDRIWYANGGPKSSGVMYGVGSHLIDQARFLAGEIEEVSGRLANSNPIRDGSGGKREIPGEEDAVALVGFQSGAMGTLRASAAAAGRKNHLSWEISCSRGTLFFDLEELNYLHVFHKDSPVKSVTGFTKVNVTQIDREHPFMDIWWPRGHGLGWEHAHINEIAHLLECIGSGAEVWPAGASFADGYQAVRVIEAIRRSHESGRRLRVDDVNP